MKLNNQKIIKKRLKNLKADLSANNDEIGRKLIELGSAYDEREELMMKYFAKENAPVNVSNLEFTGVKETDMGEVFTEFSVAFEIYCKALTEELNIKGQRRKDAFKVLEEILKLKTGECRALYLNYVKGLSTKECVKRMYISRSSFFRIKNRAINHLTKKLYEVQEEHKNESNR